MNAIPLQEIETELNKGKPYPMGVTWTEKGINFAVSVPKNANCSILFYNKQETVPFGKVQIPEQFRVGNVYTLLLDKSFKKYDYNYEVNGKVVQDPYAVQIIGKEKWGIYKENKDIKCRLNKSTFDWEGDKPLEIPYDKCIIYSLHPRGFTKHNSSKVKKRGTWKGILEKLPYIKELGINVIELMPSYEFCEIIKEEIPIYTKSEIFEEDKSKINFWGYGSGYYFAPKTSYCNSNNPIDDFKTLIKEVHKNGIEVLMEMYFDEKLNPNIIIDCLRFWHLEYHVDGFHIYGGSVPDQVILSDPLLTKAKLIVPYVNDWIMIEKCDEKFRNISECNEDFAYVSRKLLKSDEEQLENFSSKIRRNPSDKAIINYITSHNGFTLMDLVSYDVKHNEENGESNKDGNDYNYSWNCGVEGPSRKKAVKNLRLSQRKNAMLMLFLSQGVPFLLAGDEIGNTQKGNNNAYCQDNEIGWINWKGQETDAQMLEFIKKLISFRKRHPIFHQAKELKIRDYKSCGYPDISYHGSKAWYPDMTYYKRHFGIMYCGQYVKKEDGSEDNFFYVAYNLYWTEMKFDLPNLPSNMKWYIAIDSSQTQEDGIYHEGEEPLLEQQKFLRVSARTIVVLIGK
ncbi:alpha-amylase family glycosyl hydrolase [Anaerosacchariphilus polymeriproducens]|uniref:Alpha-amylase n=1 Tax=Anaerosacchariphilus polymeriproducens TaxID=1812858 RepID=A0A371AUU0_9FIRM|nr:alpha-amylase family glycosyl hydrolase [Anaerosacchariphilus polymeriproducens]RDU23309.1 alpha-amylase [Anaerosacchariphilus polymeriproducens]